MPSVLGELRSDWSGGVPAAAAGDYRWVTRRSAARPHHSLGQDCVLHEISISRSFSCEAAISQIRSRRQRPNPPLMNICLNPTSSEFAADAEELGVGK